MNTVEIKLPWPPVRLSPNARQGVFALARAKRKYRHCCWGETLLQVKPGQRDQVTAAAEGTRFTVALEFLPPDRCTYDEDNLVARMKSGLDGVADALSVNDKRFKLAAPNIGAPVKGGAVLVRLTEVLP